MPNALISPPLQKLYQDDDTHTGGLAAPPDTRGAMVAYACSPGTFASDSLHLDNSVYTKHLVRYIGRADLTIVQVFQNVCREVLQETENRQNPWFLSCLTADVRFKDVSEVPTQRHTQLALLGTYATLEDDAPPDYWGKLVPCDDKYPKGFCEGM